MNTYGNEKQNKNTPLLPQWELPTPLTLAFAADTDAFVRFSALSSDEQDEIIKRASSSHTKKELKRILKEIK